MMEIKNSTTEICEAIEEYVTENGAEAHKRRRETTKYCSNGSTIQGIKNKVLRKTNVDISESTVRRFMLAPSQARTNRKRFKGMVKAKVPHKRNNAVVNEHGDAHFCKALVKNALELGASHENEVMLASFDNKDKFNVGTLMITRHQHLSRIFKVDDAPNYPDHDFPYRDSKLTPAGYVLLKSKLYH